MGCVSGLRRRQRARARRTQYVAVSGGSQRLLSLSRSHAQSQSFVNRDRRWNVQRFVCCIYALNLFSKCESAFRLLYSGRAVFFLLVLLAIGEISAVQCDM